MSASGTFRHKGPSPLLSCVKAGAPIAAALTADVTVRVDRLGRPHVPACEQSPSQHRTETWTGRQVRDHLTAAPNECGCDLDALLPGHLRQSSTWYSADIKQLRDANHATEAGGGGARALTLHTLVHLRSHLRGPVSDHPDDLEWLYRHGIPSRAAARAMAAGAAERRTAGASTLAGVPGMPALAHLARAVAAVVHDYAHARRAPHIALDNDTAARVVLATVEILAGGELLTAAQIADVIGGVTPGTPHQEQADNLATDLNALDTTTGARGPDAQHLVAITTHRDLTTVMHGLDGFALALLFTDPAGELGCAHAYGIRAPGPSTAGAPGRCPVDSALWLPRQRRHTRRRALVWADTTVAAAAADLAGRFRRSDMSTVTDLGPVDPADIPAVFETAARMWDTLDDPGIALDAARGIHAPSPSSPTGHGLADRPLLPTGAIS